MTPTRAREPVAAKRTENIMDSVFLESYSADIAVLR